MLVETIQIAVTRIVTSPDCERRRRIEEANEAVLAAEEKYSRAWLTGNTVANSRALINAHRAFRSAVCDCLVGLRRDDEEEDNETRD